MNKLSIYLLLSAIALTSITACGESEEERLAREQARLDSLRQVEQQRIDSMMAAMAADSVEAAEAEEMEEPETPYTFVEDGPFVVQVGAWRSESKAQSFVDKWADRNYPSSYVVKYGNEDTGDIWFRVRIGYFPNREDAKSFGEEISQEIKTGYWVANAD